MNNTNNMKSVFLTKTPKGEPLGDEKSGYLASLCDHEEPKLPDFYTIPAGLILISVAYNEDKDMESAMVCDNEEDYNHVKINIEEGDKRPYHFFLIKHEWVRQMANRPLRSEL